MKYLRLILVAYALVLLVGCGRNNGEKITIPQEPSKPRHKITLYSNDGKVLETFYGKYTVSLDGGSVMFEVDRKLVLIRGTYSVVPNP